MDTLLLPKADGKEVIKLENRIDKQIGDLVGALTDPIVVFDPGWADVLPDWLKGEIKMQRLAQKCGAVICDKCGESEYILQNYNGRFCKKCLASMNAIELIETIRDRHEKARKRPGMPSMLV